MSGYSFPAIWPTTGPVMLQKAPQDNAAPKRDCLEFITCRGGRFYIAIDAGRPRPAGMTYQEARSWAKFGTVAFDTRPYSWNVCATFCEPFPRCVRLVSATRGTCFVELREGAPVPITLAELSAVAVALPGAWTPQGKIVGTLEV
ncbi:MAG TPA: hypothetical protein PKH77_04940 [Anaerolineae bacterium]|nr:hypothetical protein [Anaerolineae bacterium]